jgi:hypothetical protein
VGAAAAEEERRVDAAGEGEIGGTARLACDGELGAGTEELGGGGAEEMRRVDGDEGVGVGADDEAAEDLDGGGAIGVAGGAVGGDEGAAYEGAAGRQGLVHVAGTTEVLDRDQAEGADDSESHGVARPRGRTSVRVMA